MTRDLDEHGADDERQAIAGAGPACAPRRGAETRAHLRETIAGLEALAMQLRANIVAKETALAWARDEIGKIQAAIPSLPKRLVLARRVAELETRVVELMRARSAAHDRHEHNAARHSAAPRAALPRGPGPGEKVVLWIGRNRTAEWTERAMDGRGTRVLHADGTDASALETGLADADLVVCQTGCVSHNAWWRVQDYCTRTGKQCVLVDRPDALRQLFASSTPTPARQT